MDKYLDMIYESPYTQSLLNFVKLPFEYLKNSLSDQSYEHVIDIVQPVLKVVMILLVIQIVYSVLHFFYTLLTRARFKIKVLISAILSLLVLTTLYMAYRYISGG